MLTVEFNKKKGSVEIYGDKEGLKLLVKRITALIRNDAGSYIAFGQGEDPKHHKENCLVDYYSIFVCNEPKDTDEQNN